jgi:hypothetical protein
MMRRRKKKTKKKKRRVDAVRQERECRCLHRPNGEGVAEYRQLREKSGRRR